MKRIRAVCGAAVPAVFAAVLAFAAACGGEFVDPGMLDGGGLGKSGGGGGMSRGALDTAAGEPLRTAGLAADGVIRASPPDEWPPLWGIGIRFPETMYTAGNFAPGEGTVTETGWSQLEKDVVWEINKFRADPVGWCKQNGLPVLDGIPVYEEFYGSGPRRGSYNFPARPLQPSMGLHKAALHQCLRGAVAHSDGSRVSVYVNWRGWGENVGPYGIVNQASGGATAAARIVNEFIRDRGVADKGHRTNIANPQWTHVGIGCINNIIVMQFGMGVSEKNPQP